MARRDSWRSKAARTIRAAATAIQSGGWMTMPNKLRSILKGRRPSPKNLDARAGAAESFDQTAKDAPYQHALRPRTPEMLDDEQQLADDMRGLSAHLARMNERRAKIAAARAPVERLTVALSESKAAVDSAVAALTRFDAQEREMIEAWAQTGAGDRPAPRAQRKLERAIEDANRSLATVKAALEAKKAALAPLDEELGALAIRRDVMVVNVLCDHAEILGRHYKAALDDLVRVGGELRALNMCFAEMFGHVTLMRPDAPLYANALQPPALLRGHTAPLFAEMRLVAGGFYLRAHAYRDIEAIATVDDVLSAAGQWQTYARALMGVDPAGDDQTATKLASLVAENADLREKLPNPEHPKTATGVDP